MLAFVSIQCTDNSSINDPVPPKNANVKFNKKQKSAKNLAKILAYELQKNDRVRQEVFAKISAIIDGDFEVLLDHLNSNTLGEIENAAKKLRGISYLKKSASNFGAVEGIRINELKNNFDNLQIAMPYAERWTDNEIETNGGLIVAYYPFGVQDTEIKELVGYNKNGEKVIITKETAPNIPYVILSENERKAILDKISPSLKNEFKKFSGYNNATWKKKKLDELRTMIPNKILDEISMLPAIGGEDGGSGSGTPTGRTDGSWEILAAMQVLDDQEPFFTNGDPEIRVEFKSVKAGTSEKFYYDDAFDGTWVWFWHEDNTGWIYLNQKVIQWLKNDYGTLLQVFIWEYDGGSSTKWETSVSYKNESGFTQTTKVSVSLGSDDDKMGTRSIHYDHSKGEIYGTGYCNLKMTY